MYIYIQYIYVYNIYMYKYIYIYIYMRVYTAGVIDLGTRTSLVQDQAPLIQRFGQQKHPGKPWNPILEFVAQLAARDERTVKVQAGYG